MKTYLQHFVDESYGSEEARTAVLPDYKKAVDYIIDHLIALTMQQVNMTDVTPNDSYPINSAYGHGAMIDEFKKGVEEYSAAGMASGLDPAEFRAQNPELVKKLADMKVQIYSLDIAILAIDLIRRGFDGTADVSEAITEMARDNMLKLLTARFGGGGDDDAVAVEVRM